MLKRASNAEFGNSSLAGAGDVVTEKDDLAPVAFENAGKEVEHGGFARAVRANQTEDFAGHHLEADLTHRLEAAEAFHNVVKHQELGARLRHCSPRQRSGTAWQRRRSPSRQKAQHTRHDAAASKLHGENVKHRKDD